MGGERGLLARAGKGCGLGDLLNMLHCPCKGGRSKEEAHRPSSALPLGFPSTLHCGQTPTCSSADLGRPRPLLPCASDCLFPAEEPVLLPLAGEHGQLHPQAHPQGTGDSCSHPSSIIKQGKDLGHSHLLPGPGILIFKARTRDQKSPELSAGPQSLPFP